MKIILPSNSLLSSVLALSLRNSCDCEIGKTSGRADDSSEEIVRNRIKVYYSETEILKKYYDKQGKYYGINGVGTIDDITKRLNSVVNKL